MFWVVAQTHVISLLKEEFRSPLSSWNGGMGMRWCCNHRKDVEMIRQRNVKSQSQDNLRMGTSGKLT